MSYRIEYDNRVGKYEVRKEKSGILPYLVVFSLAAALWICPRSREMVRSLLIPGNDQITTAAFQLMTDDLRSGAGMYDALYDFCDTIIRGE